MKMTIDEALKVWLPVIQMGVETMPECKEALDMAIDAMRKYQKIKDIYYHQSGEALENSLRAVIEDDGYDLSENRPIDCPLIEIKDLEIVKPFIINTLSMLRQDLLDHLAEEESPYHISDVGIGLEIAINILNEYEERLKI